MSRLLSIVTGVFGRACLIYKDRRVGMHAHAEPHVVIKISGADFAYEVGGVVAACTRDTVVLVNALEAHANRSIGKSHSIILALYLSPEWLVERHSSLLVGGKLFERHSPPVTAPLRQSADRLAAEMLQVDRVRHNRLQFLVSEVALSVFDDCAGPSKDAERFLKLNDYRIRRAVSYMREHVDQPLGLADVASKVGLSRSRFFDLFGACTGLSPKHYLDMLRMETAIAGLSSSRRSIAEVAANCGYSAHSHFTRFFVKQIGVTPSEYRRAAGLAVAPN